MQSSFSCNWKILGKSSHNAYSSSVGSYVFLNTYSGSHMRRRTCFKDRKRCRQCSGVSAPDRSSVRQCVGNQRWCELIVATMAQLVKHQTLQDGVFTKQIVRIFMQRMGMGMNRRVRLWQSGRVQHLVHAPQRWCHHQCQCQPPRHPGRAQLVHAGKNGHGKQDLQRSAPN